MEDMPLSGVIDLGSCEIASRPQDSDSRASHSDRMVYERDLVLPDGEDHPLAINPFPSDTENGSQARM